jgi:hypothetical protein
LLAGEDDGDDNPNCHDQERSELDEVFERKMREEFPVRVRPRVGRAI